MSRLCTNKMQADFMHLLLLRDRLFNCQDYKQTGFYSGVMRGSISQVLDYSWDCVTSLFWARYPNPYASHVLHEDILERSMLNDHTLYTKRLLLKQGFGNIPFWLKRILSNRQELILEESIIDIQKKEILTSTRNLGGLARYAVLVEDCRYVPSIHRPESTQIDRQLAMQCSLSGRILYPLWSFLKHRYNKSAEASFRGYQYICQQHSRFSAPNRLRTKASSPRCVPVAFRVD